jgi:hypothetical protein
MLCLLRNLRDGDHFEFAALWLTLASVEIEGLSFHKGSPLPLNGNGWSPTRVTRFVQGFATSTGPVRVDTDSGEGFLKALGNPEGPHALACELVGSMLADWMGLATFDFSLIQVTEDDEIPFAKGGKAEPGMAFISRAEKGFPWGGDAKILRSIANPLDITGLVVLDTWILNDDRYAPDGQKENRDNVFFIESQEDRNRIQIVAMDFTHAFRHGADINRRVSFIERIQDDRIYGLFPGFRNFLNRDEAKRLLGMLEGFDRATAEGIISRIPLGWDVDRDGRSALSTLITERAHFLPRYFESKLWVDQLALEEHT